MRELPLAHRGDDIAALIDHAAQVIRRCVAEHDGREVASWDETPEAERDRWRTTAQACAAAWCAPSTLLAEVACASVPQHADRCADAQALWSRMCFQLAGYAGSILRRNDPYHTAH